MWASFSAPMVLSTSAAIRGIEVVKVERENHALYSLQFERLMLERVSSRIIFGRGRLKVTQLIPHHNLKRRDSRLKE